jgi:AbiV family abortive infection protein
MSIRELPDRAPAQVVELQDALLANADRLLNSALAVLDLGNVALSRSLAILGMEESGKAIALHQRRVAMATEPEGEPFASTGLQELWADHELKLRLVHDFLVDEEYWFGVKPSDPITNREYLGAIKSWARRHDKLKRRGFYVDIDKVGGTLTPMGVTDERSLSDVIASRPSDRLAVAPWGTY